MKAIESVAGKVVFDHCVNESARMLALREAVNALIAGAVRKSAE